MSRWFEQSLGSMDSHVKRGICWPGPEYPWVSSHREWGLKVSTLGIGMAF